MRSPGETVGERGGYDFLVEGGEPGEDAAALVGALADQGFVMEDPEDEANLLRYQFERYRYSDSGGAAGK